MSTATFQPDPTHPSYCQICGRAVASEADRAAGNAFHCGLCNEVRLATPASTGYVPGPGGAPGADPEAGPAGSGPIPPFAPFAAVPGPGVAGPNPLLAGALGFIPGVGAMYNAQYAKGIVHLIVFAILVSLADSYWVFGWFVAGWIFYQAFEAYHTARARRDGTLLPNPFGLNDIGERFGFGKAWPSASSTPPPASPAGQTPAPGAPPYQAAPTPNWGSPWESARPNMAPAGFAYGGYQSPYTPPVPPIPPFDPDAYAPVDAMGGFQPQPYVARNRFPAGAIWLIALGTLFLLNTSNIFRGFNSRVLLPLLFLGLGIAAFVRRMTDTGYGLADDGTPGYRVRLFRAARGAVWLILLGVIFFLADFDILPWSRSWPLFLILAGVMTFLERAVYNGAAATAAYGYPAPGAPPYVPPTQAATSPSTEPVTETRMTTTEHETPNQEGR